MAIEAAHQLADPVKKITGYRLRDVAIHKALVVSSNTGTETQFYLRPSREAAGEFLTWSVFRVCGYENGEWSDHCQGAIAVEYETQKVGLNHDQEIQETQDRHTKKFDDATISCTKSKGSRKLYEQLDSLGLTYGPTFQTLQSIHCNSEGEAIATVNMHKWASETSAGYIRSPHVIHPAALDAVLQLIIPSLIKGANGLFPIMVPTQIRNLWISDNHGGPQLSMGHVSLKSEATMKLYAKAKYTGFRSATSSATSGKPCIVGDFQTTFVSDNVASSFAGFKRKRLCYNLDWKPDPDLLDDRQINAYCLTADGRQSSNEEAMVEDKLLVCHLALWNSDRWSFHKGLEKDKPYLRKYIEWGFALYIHLPGKSPG